MYTKNKAITIFSVIVTGVLSLFAEPKLLAHWSFDSTSGSTYYDVTGHGHNATVTGTSVSLTEGIKGKAINCTDNNYEIVVSNSSDSFNVPKFSFETFLNSNVKSSEINTAAVLFNFHHIGPEIRNGFSTHISPNGKITFGLSNSSGSEWMTAFSDVVIKQNTWYHLVCSFDGTFMKIFINGELSGRTAYTGMYIAPKFDARIGCQKRTDGIVYYRFNGKLDETKFYNYALTEDTVLSHYNSIFPVPTLIPCKPNPTTFRQPLFSWYSLGAGSIYRLQISTDKQFTSPFISVPTSDTFYTPTVSLPMGTLYWHVSKNTDTLHWSLLSSVIIQDSTIPFLIPYTPDPTRERQPTFFWNKVISTSSYTIQIDTSGNFVNPYVTDVTSDTFYKPLIKLPATKILWRVKSNVGAQYSLVDTLTINNDSIPFLIRMTPDTQKTERPVFHWFKAVGAASYRIQIDLSGNFVNPYISVPVEDTAYTPSVNLSSGHMIYWRVSANTNLNKYSTVDSFYIDIPLSTIGFNNNYGSGNPLTIKSCNHFLTVDFTVTQKTPVKLQIFTLSGICLAAEKIDVAFPGIYTIRFGKKNLSKSNYLLIATLNEKKEAKLFTIQE
jgi:hypothetical protein